VAIGGGEIGRPGHPVETAAIDRCIVRLTGRRQPRLLFLPTATQDSALYVETGVPPRHGAIGTERRCDLLVSVRKLRLSETPPCRLAATQNPWTEPRSALLCPHYHDGDARAQLRAMMRRTPGVAIALDTCCAIVIVNGGYRILSSNADASAYKVYWTRGEFREEQIPKRRAFSSMEEVTRR
jgi:hypothetical protein